MSAKPTQRAPDTLAQYILKYYAELDPAFRLPREVSIMNPYRSPQAWQVTRQFYEKYYADQKPRILLFGINPGRWGAGITGIPFTDPIRLEMDCRIANPFAKKPELSSEFIYRMIAAMGGPGKFYRQYLVSALSPLGFTRLGKNLNYYDLPELQKACTGFIIKNLKTHLTMPGITGDYCYCIGEGKNLEFFRKLNQEHGFFREIVPLPHPRWIMQYRRKMLDEFITLYISRLKDKNAAA